MPIPLTSFTKSKWLAFFAELTAKVTHHNVLVVMEGCEVIKRILVSSVSVAAFLEEGELITHLVDTIAGDMLSSERRSGGPPLFMAEKLLFTQLETLSLFVDMMLALYVDKDPYYCLLVLARAGDILVTLVKLLQRQHPRFFGLIAAMVQSLLSLPLGREVQNLPLNESHSVTFRCHVQKLQAAVTQTKEILQEALETLQALYFAMDGAMRYCSHTLLNMASHRFRQLQKCGKQGNSTGRDSSARQNVGLNRSEPAPSESAMDNTLGSHDTTCLTVDETKMSINTTVEGEDMIPAYSTNTSIPEEEYNDCFDRLSNARSHEEFLFMLNRIWCLTVADGEELQRRFTSLNFNRAFRRFLETMPSNHLDQVVFTSVLLWLSRMMSGFHLLGETRDSILSVAGSSLIKIILQDLNTRDLLLSQREASDLSTVDAAALATSAASISKVNLSNSSPMLDERSGSLVERPSISLVVFSFLLIAERACEPREMAQWIREAGLFVLLESLIRNVEQTKSALIDTPTTVDGTLSDEVYLAGVMAATRTEHVTLAALSCKLLSSVIWNHHAVLNELLASETFGMLKSIIPLLLTIGVHNPTLTSAIENSSGSALHHLPSCPRSSRYTSLGECSLVALDACLWLVQVSQMDAVCLSDIILRLPALSRATRNSVHPPLRASAYRCLSRLCASSTELMTIMQEMPSVVNAAVNSVLEYTKTAPQWEAAAAAEWLTDVIRIASSDAEMEQSFDFTQSALPAKLLELASCNGITYATAAMMFLMTSLFEQQTRLAALHKNSFTNVLLPYGKRSLECWWQLIFVVTRANEKLVCVHEKQIPAVTTTKDALSRFLSGIEGISVHFSFVCSLARGLLFLFASYPILGEQVSNDVMCSFLVSVFALPSPKDVFDMLSSRFGVKVEQRGTLGNSYEVMLQWVIELFSYWFKTANRTAKEPPTLSPAFFRCLCNIMGNNCLSQRIRAHICSLVSDIVVARSEVLAEVLAASSGDLFTASLGIHPSSSVCGMQCRLVLLFAPANEKAHEVEWVAAKLAELDGHVQSLKKNGGMLGGEEMSSLMMRLSFLSSVMAFPGCRALSQNVMHSFCASLRTTLGYETTQRAAFQAAGALARSSQGRRCLLHEVCSTGDPLARSSFGRIVGITLGVSQSGEQLQLQKENDNAMKNVPLSEREAFRAAVVSSGFDICATACGNGGEPFTHAVMKLRGVEQVESLLLSNERRRVATPLGPFRLLAALSFQADAQLAIMRQAELMTILVETAANTNYAGSLSLLTLRNLCFNPTLKTKICQDSRLLLTFKAALMTEPSPQIVIHDARSPGSKDCMTLVPSPKGELQAKRVSLQTLTEQTLLQQTKKSECVATTGDLLEASETCRRQQLAVSAFWSLMYDNQRGKSYVRGVLNESPAVNINKLMQACSDVTVCAPDLETFQEKMSEAIGNIKLLGKGAI
ncbi:hypothetical protein TraAM80_00145 [Trypanosoma rangeli]|uniref:Uncharacterized protein n=1 Tax=Trypanosoma rangeli TaxID=5698 RepID=A0A3R7N4T4_TRYRA|nr:uncharacterized protein TraAM80_00145 [Trypanosoma rangeli]RNF12789.1 hypothetical protein TraAM80_00145 [Trypanosoma rangeli]|eukprot:RNF12789.1 hypothetical protein TraAM80_00145 [Trypanosoma rangeli]